LAKIIESWWMLCYPLKITPEPLTTTSGSKPCAFQNSIEFGRNSPNLTPFSFLSSSFLLQLDQGDTLASHLSLSHLLPLVF
jgi:hypothetical protein